MDYPISLLIFSLSSYFLFLLEDAETKKKLFSTFTDRPVEVKPKRVDKFEVIKGRLLKDKYQDSQY